MTKPLEVLNRIDHWRAPDGAESCVMCQSCVALRHSAFCFVWLFLTESSRSLFSQPSSRCTTPGLSAATLASLGGTSSRRGSTDTGSAYDPDTSLSELRVRFTLSTGQRFCSHSHVAHIHILCFRHLNKHLFFLHMNLLQHRLGFYLLKCLLLLFFFLYAREDWMQHVSCVAVPYIWVAMWMPAGLSVRWQHGCFVICPW